LSLPTRIEFGSRSGAISARAAKAFGFKFRNAFRLLSDDRSARSDGPAGSLRALSLGYVSLNRTRRLQIRSGIRRNHAALAPGSYLRDSNFSRKFARRLTSFSARDKQTGGNVPHFKIGVSIMRVDHPQLNKRDRRAEPSFWVEEPTDDALSLLENALRGDEPALRRDERRDEAHMLIEENDRLRELLSQLSDLIRKNGVHQR
jgi:hypothetical protein